MNYCAGNCGDRVRRPGEWCITCSPSDPFRGDSGFSLYSTPSESSRHAHNQSSAVSEAFQPKPHPERCATGEPCGACERSPFELLLNYAALVNFGSEDQKDEALENISLLVTAITHERYLNRNRNNA
jgi:hypothetical protein